VEALEIWCRATSEGVRRDAPDLSARQMAILLTVYLRPPPHTVRGLAQDLRISKPAVSRALDRLCKLEFVRRKKDEADKRNILVTRTVRGSIFLREYGEIITAAAHAAEETGQIASSGN
jgi:DNA-binding MarR family transcriptional regulator